MPSADDWFYRALLPAMFAALTAIFANIFPGERPGLREWRGILMMAGGVLSLRFRR
ncbi:MAG: hypothetical protein WC830_08515 [Burkholderiales bacterium]|jgi:uncharacterized membrane protein